MCDIVKNLNFLLQGRPIEVRMIRVNGKGTVSGYYDDYFKLQKDLFPYNGKNSIYFTMNSINDEIKARSYNHLTTFARNTTQDTEIVRRDLILVDLDPIRPSGLSASDDEHEKALALSQRIKDDLSVEGFNCIIRTDSGSGAHLLIPINMPNDDESTKLIKNFLVTLDKEYSTTEVEVDVSTSNASRITKLYGTMACKGDNLPERPHRISKILEDIDNFIFSIVPTEVISDYVKNHNLTIQQEPKIATKEFIAKETDKINCAEFSVKDWVEKKGFEVTKEKRVENGTLYEIFPCMFDTGHDQDSGMYIVQRDNGFLQAGCPHRKCEGNDWNMLWNMYEKKKRNPNLKILKELKKESQDKKVADTVLDIVSENGHDIFKNQFGNLMVRIPELNDVVLELEDSDYASYLLQLYYMDKRVAARKDNIQTAIDVLKAIHIFSSKTRLTFKRLGSLGNEKYIYNLNDEQQRIVCISKNHEGRFHHEVKQQDEDCVFIKDENMKSQVAPDKEDMCQMSFVELMKKYFGVLSDEELLLHNVLLCYRILYGLDQPLAMYIGDMGSGKTSLATFDANIINPSIGVVTAKPRTEKDWSTLLNANDVVVIDNVSHLTNAETDILCQACHVTGSHSTRKLYTDSELVHYKLYTAIYLTSIKLTTFQTDLLDRTFFFHTKRLETHERKEAIKFKMEFESDLPNIITSMFNIIVEALNLMVEDDDYDQEYIIRLTSFQKYGSYLARAMGYTKEEFIEALKSNSNDIQSDLADESGFVELIKSFVEEEGYIKDTPTEILGKFNRFCEKHSIPKDKAQANPSVFARKLNDYKEALKAVGIARDVGKMSGGIRYIELIDTKASSVEADTQTCIVTSPTGQTLLPHSNPYDDFFEGIDTEDDEVEFA